MLFISIFVAHILLNFTTMKKLLTLFAIGLTSISLFATEGDTKKPITIVKDKPVDDTIIRPRTPDVSTGIDAYYQNGVIYLQFGWDLGCMDVSVTNHATGEQWLDAVCSDSGAEAVYISTSAGNYTIELTTDDGTTYSGTFVL